MGGETKQLPIPVKLAFFSLQTVLIYHVGSIPRALGNLTALDELHLDGNVLTGESRLRIYPQIFVPASQVPSFLEYIILVPSHALSCRAPGIKVYLKLLPLTLKPSTMRQDAIYAQAGTHAMVLVGCSKRAYLDTTWILAVR